jgi:GNAT superfamily N-acetyltransferase
VSEVAFTPDPAPDSPASGWNLRQARLEDVPAVASAVAELLGELSAYPDSAQALEGAAQSIIEDENAGILILAQAGDGQIVGLLGCSWQIAVRVPGRYGLIQELWVAPAWRGRAVGRDLLAAVVDLAQQLEIGRIEVGLPSERFAGLTATRDFYLANGFTAIGTRMRRLV